MYNKPCNIEVKSVERHSLIYFMKIVKNYLKMQRINESKTIEEAEDEVLNSRTDKRHSNRDTIWSNNIYAISSVYLVV